MVAIWAELVVRYAVLLVLACAAARLQALAQLVDLKSKLDG